jgi:hypothetical protein
MKIHPISPSDSLNKAYRKSSLRREQVETFKASFKRLINRINEKESEENLKNIVADFLKETWYKTDYEINTKDRKDLVIHNGKSASLSVGVILEVKRPGNKAEMISAEKPNAKAFHELILYYLRERTDHNNSQIKHLIVTNIWDWYIFDGVWFEKNIFRNNKLKADYEDFKVSGQDTRYFYDEIAAKFLDSLEEKIPVTFFSLKDYEEIITNLSPEDDIKLLDLYKIFSPEHLLSKSFANDSNSLNKEFYNELLHIIGLGEMKEKSKKLIGRKPEGKRDEASILENTISILRSRGKMAYIPEADKYGDSEEERLFSIGLELVITWLNRILFLKLLEGQLISYHKGDKNYAFLNSEVIEDFDQLNELFFDVLAVPEEHRLGSVKEKFGRLPYLNSSLFEESELERAGITMAELKDRLELPVYSSTVLKDESGRRISGEKKTLTYLFEFLDAYDFSSDSKAEIQEQNKSLISASVLGLIFEKINGYKDGSYFTPGFITMYMCRETIKRAVVQKFNERKGWNVEDFGQLYDRIEDKREANQLINSLKICDPAVGSGHFLVSALNEIIAIKSELKILLDRGDKTLRDYQVEVVNDELVVTDDDGRFFRYNPLNPESCRVQETLFHEKQTLIENCLFGVDINPKSVMICRLRLWIELLKNAYYVTHGRDGVPVTPRLETLPNLDINIKCGNSLISRFALDADLGEALRKSKWNIESYRLAVQTYRTAESKEQKRAMEKLIRDIKSDFETEVTRNDKRLLRLNRLKGELINLTMQTSFFEQTKAEKTTWEKKVKKLTAEISSIENELEEIKNNRIYENAFEWRFEFPEVLDHDGKFTGFDVVIGNPPYFSLSKIKEQADYFERAGFQTYSKGSDIYCLFFERGNQILKINGVLTYITSNSWLRAIYGDLLKKYFKEEMQPLMLLNVEDVQIFDEATVESNIITIQKGSKSLPFPVCNLGADYIPDDSLGTYFLAHRFYFEIPKTSEWVIGNQESSALISKIGSNSISLKDLDITINFGIKTGLNEAFIIDKDKRDELILMDPKNEEIIKPILRGRDVQKYSCQFSDNFAICFFPSLNLDIEDYPVIQDYFQKFGKNRLEQTGNQGSRKRTNNKWFETQDSISYWRDFEKPKIIWGEISDKPKFAFDDQNYYAEATTFLMTGERLKFLLGILNSKVSEWYFNQISTTTGMGTNRWKKYKIELLPIKIGNERIENKIETLVNQIIEIKRFTPHADTKDLEKEIDELVYDLYELTEEERRIVEGGL